MPAVSIVMPVRNGADFLAAALDSLLAQTFYDFELLVIDDGSHDATPELMADYAARDARIRLLQNTGFGVVDALNLGLEAANGELIARMDHDDFARPGRLAAQVEFLRNHPEILVVGTQIQPFSERRNRLRPSRYPLAPGEIRVAMERTNCLAHPSVIMRSAPVRAAGGYRKLFRYVEDYDLWLRLLELGDLANIDIIGLDYRLHANMSTLRGVEQVALETVVTQIFAQHRSRGEPEPEIGREPVQRQTLHKLGMNDREIARLLRKAWFKAARLAHRGGDGQSMRFCLERSGPWILPEGGPGDLIDYAWRWLKVRL